MKRGLRYFHLRNILLLTLNKNKMREIKFRGLCEKTKEWIYGYYFEAEYCDSFGKCSYIKRHGENGRKVIPETVGQFTGLTDKNGKELYFDDYVRLKYNDRIYHVKQDDYGIPLFADFKDGQDKSFEWYFLYMGETDNDFEIIGNIYENPNIKVP